MSEEEGTVEAYENAQLAFELVERINSQVVKNVASTTRIGSFDVENIIIELYGEDNVGLDELYKRAFKESDYTDEEGLCKLLKYYEICASIKEQKMFNAM